ncbi:MAG: hypothetical protein ABI418_10590, partial [Jatrophihabitantaceae bacterium]
MTETPHAPLDPAIDDWRVQVLPNREPTTIAEAREQARVENARALAALNPALVPASEVDAEIPADAAGPALPIRILRPATVPGGAEVDRTPLPTVVYFHGGGFVIG